MAQQPQKDTELAVMKAEIRTDIHAVAKSVHKVAEDQIGIVNQINALHTMTVAKFERVDGDIDALHTMMVANFARVDGDIDAFKTEFVAFKTETNANFAQVNARLDKSEGDSAAVKAALVLIADALGIGDAVRQLLTQQ